MFCVLEPRNYDPLLHPMEASREYIRALNAAKLQKVFAKPFTASLDGHRNVVNCMSKHPQKLSIMLSGAGDGEVSTFFSCYYRTAMKLQSIFIILFFNFIFFTLTQYVEKWKHRFCRGVSTRRLASAIAAFVTVFPHAAWAAQ